MKSSKEGTAWLAHRTKIERIPKESQLAADWPIPLAEAKRQVGDSQSLKARVNLSPRDSILHQTVGRLPAANQVFLGSQTWTVDIFQEGRNLRSAPPQRKHMADSTPRKPSSWDPGGDKMHYTPGILCSPSTWSPELLRPRNGTKRMLN